MNKRNETGSSETKRKENASYLPDTLQTVLKCRRLGVSLLRLEHAGLTDWADGEKLKSALRVECKLAVFFPGLLCLFVRLFVFGVVFLSGFCLGSSVASWELPDIEAPNYELRKSTGNHASDQLLISSCETSGSRTRPEEKTSVVRE